MIEIKPNTVVGELGETLEGVMVTTGGYLTEEKVLTCDNLQKVGSARTGERIDFFSDGLGNLLSFHYGHSLDLKRKVLAIDYFPGVGENGITKTLDKIMKEIRGRK